MFNHFARHEQGFADWRRDGYPAVKPETYQYIDYLSDPADEWAFVVQNLGMIADLSDPRALCDRLNAFFSHTEPAHEDFNKAVDEFKERVPDLARGLVDLIDEAHKNNPGFIKAFEQFYELCKSSLNPNLSIGAVDEMLVQHLLTERLIRTVFDSQDFTRRNVIAAEIEKVIDALVSQSFKRHDGNVVLRLVGCVEGRILRGRWQRRGKRLRLPQDGPHRPVHGGFLGSGQFP